MSGDRPEAAAEHSEDRARTVAQPLPWTAARASYASDKRWLRMQMHRGTPRGPDTCTPTRQRHSEHADARPRANAFLCTAEARGLLLVVVVLPCGLPQGLVRAHRAKRGMSVSCP
jgi:hypothetical protein